MTTVWNGRMAALQAAGVPAAISWSQGLLKRDAWGIPKGAKNKANAMKFAAYSTMAIPQARIAFAIPYGSVNNESNEYIPPEAAGGAAERARHQVAARQLQLRLVDRQPRHRDQPLQQMAAELSAMNGSGRGASVSADRPGETLRPHQRGRRRVARHPLGRVPDPAGPQRLGQDHDPDDDRGLRDADRGRHRHRWQVGGRHAALPPQHRHGVPELRAVPAPHGRRQYRLPAEAARRAEGRARQAGRRGARAGASAGLRRAAIRASSRAASSSAWRWRAPSSSSRGCC